MNLSDKILTLRKQRGLSQEELAEQMHVSRQAISKWENGASVPDNSSLIHISDFFGITLDTLMKDELPLETAVASEVETHIETPLDTPHYEKAETAKALNPAEPKFNGKTFAGIIMCLICVGILGFVGYARLFNPSMASEAETSSMVTIDGIGFLIILAVLMLIAGVVLLVVRRPGDS